MGSLFFTAEDLNRNLEKAREISNPLDRLNDRILWEMFRAVLNRALDRKKEDVKGPGGRPAFDRVLMFKVTMLQRFYNLSDAQTEMQILDRLSFQRFLGLQPGESVPDEKTIWLFKNQLAKAGAEKALFKEFDRYLKDHQMIVRAGVILDSSFIEMPHQHLSEEEKEAVDEGKTPEGWEKPETQAKVRQKDTDARWTKKYSRSYYGYKNHVKVDAGSKLILTWETTDAAVHDSQLFKSLVTREDAGQRVYADCAYQGTEYIVHAVINRVGWDVCEKAYRNSPLTEHQRNENRERSRMRSRVEHVFGFMENSMNGMRLRTVGKLRTAFGVGMMNLVYNLCRYEQLVRPQ
jgi:IS5 family transposase